jgi:alpha-N-arabinofuranosidase
MTLAAILAVASVATFDWFEYRSDDHLSDALCRTICKPDLEGFYPGPGITRVSTFAWSPGIPVFRRRDLVNWTQIGNAIGQARRGVRALMSRRGASEGN